MVRENPTWRAPRIHGELLKLGFRVSERTVSRYLPKIKPAKDKAQRWMTFLRNHRDAITAMEGAGPINGTDKQLGWLIAGTDAIACETICCKLINLPPEDLPIIKTARKKNYGTSNLSDIQLLGDQYQDSVCTDFQHATINPVRFSIPYVCKSVCKQIILLAKSS